jgi:hypothetical protein
MRTKVLLGLAVAVMLVVSVATIGSNMGFKISIPLYKYSAGTHTGLNWVALPYYVSYTTASQVWTELNTLVGGPVELDQYQESNGTYLQFDNDSYGDDFNIAPSGTLVEANAMLVKVGSTVNWVVVGSHNPSMAVPLYKYAAGAHTGLNWRAVPYHTTAASASALWTQLNAAVGGPVEIDQYQESNGTYLQFDNDSYGDDFTVVPGQAILIKVGASTNWTPAHY